MESNAGVRHHDPRQEPPRMTFTDAWLLAQTSANAPTRTALDYIRAGGPVGYVLILIS
ncbi:MAG: hypothetical protein JNK70_10470, partial [Phycisphaerae bacterium]|nr:hypothetical protein [Phycisphaerae bacterium]